MARVHIFDVTDTLGAVKYLVIDHKATVTRIGNLVAIARNILTSSHYEVLQK
jgi:hypothetical protein